MSSLASERNLHTATSLVPADFLSSLFVAELLQPSRPLWIVSPWVSDVELVDNTSRQLAGLCPAWPSTMIRLSVVIKTLLDRGGSLVLVVNDSPHNDELRSRLDQAGLLGPDLRWICSPDLHEKGIVGEHFTLDGSMNLTYNGVNVNKEYLIYRTDAGTVAERRLTLSQRWLVPA